MNIQEDYVSFEVAKLLKEKGFNEPCLTQYSSIHCDGIYKIYTEEPPATNEQLEQAEREELDVGGGYITEEDLERLHVIDISAPTLQMATKWLREVHKLYVNVCPSVEGYYWTEKWHSYVENLEKRYPFGRFIGTFTSHEQACEAAIKYCLTNLI